MESKTAAKVSDMAKNNPQIDLLGFVNDEEVAKQFNRRF